jgi:quercetin dioxygenase-like cupin family protein
VFLTAIAVGVSAGVFGGVTSGFATSSPTTTSNGVLRTPLGQASPTNAPGQTLYLQQVTIAPGARLAEHFHQGTQVARVVQGVLTYNIVSGSVAVVHVDGASETVAGPRTIRLRAGESLVETAGLVHFGSNRGHQKVVIELTALLQEGAPLSTPVGTGVAGTPLHLAVSLDSQARTLYTAGAGGSIVYGWNRLTGTSAVGGQPTGVEMLGNVTYTKGSGPFFGFVTFTFSDGSTLGVQMQGSTIASADTTSAAFAATLGVVGGTGRYEAATGTGTFVGSRTAALGTTVASTFDLVVNGVR